MSIIKNIFRSSAPQARPSKHLGKHPIITKPVVWRGLPSLAGTDLALSGSRYVAWVHNLKAVASLPTEFILPRIEITYRNELPKSMQAAEERYLEDSTAAEAIANMQWGYYYYLGGGKSTMDRFPQVRDINRASSILRMQMINSVVSDIVGSEKSSLTLLDFACNWGGMAIDMAYRGFGSVTAFDFKPDNIRRAQMLSDYMGIQNIKFSVEDAFSLPDSYADGFDVVFNLGLLYHVTDPVRLVKTTYDLTRKIAVFDTLCHKEPFSGYVQAYIDEKAIKRSGMGAQQIELHPTYRGLIDLITFAGFDYIVEVVPIIGPEYPNREKEHYFVGHRRTLIAFK